jgi:uncharacterized protein (TIGR03083 family)
VSGVDPAAGHPLDAGPVDLHDLAAILEGGIPQAGPPPVTALLTRASALRPPGRAVGPWASDEVDPLAAFEAVLDEFSAELAALPADAWEAPAPTARAGWRVRDVVAHVTEVNRYHASLLGGPRWIPPPGLEHDHLGMTDAGVAEAARSTPEALLAQWQRSTQELLTLLRATAAHGEQNTKVAFTGLVVRNSTLPVIRVFEIWTHADDVRSATGRPLKAPPAATVRMLCDLAVASLPLGLAVAGRSQPGRTVRMVLTGPGGGAWSQALAAGQPAGEPDATLVADAVDFCRLAATRLSPGDLACAVSGDASLVADVLNGVAVFAA